MQELNFDIASEFLVMAATLLHWKSKALLPQENAQAGAAAGAEAELTQEDLIRQLMELERFRSAARDIGQLPRLWEDVFHRINPKPPTEKVWREMEVTQLALSYQDLLARQRKRTTVLKKETVSLTDKIMEFRDRLQMGKLIDMRDLVQDLKLRPEVVVTFLASLELSRLKKLRVHQNETYAPIYLELVESLANFNVSLASGFDAVAQVEQAIAHSDHATANPNGVHTDATNTNTVGATAAAGDLSDLPHPAQLVPTESGAATHA
jgi:segregation and condensation protein A